MLHLQVHPPNKVCDVLLQANPISILQVQRHCWAELVLLCGLHLWSLLGHCTIGAIGILHDGWMDVFGCQDFASSWGLWPANYSFSSSLSLSLCLRGHQLAQETGSIYLRSMIRGVTDSFILFPPLPQTPRNRNGQNKCSWSWRCPINAFDPPSFITRPSLLPPLNSTHFYCEERAQALTAFVLPAHVTHYSLCSHQSSILLSFFLPPWGILTYTSLSLSLSFFLSPW